jgi:hypothetical protein
MIDSREDSHLAVGKGDRRGRIRAPHLIGLPGDDGPFMRFGGSRRDLPLRSAYSSEADH